MTICLQIRESVFVLFVFLLFCFVKELTNLFENRVNSKKRKPSAVVVARDESGKKKARCLEGVFHYLMVDCPLFENPKNRDTHFQFVSKSLGLDAISFVPVKQSPTDWVFHGFYSLLTTDGIPIPRATPPDYRQFDNGSRVFMVTRKLGEVITNGSDLTQTVTFAAQSSDE